MQEEHKVFEEQAVQFIGQSKQLPFDKYRPTSHVIQD
jgi:hypothetical protein